MTTPAQHDARRGAIDVARVGALIIVVLGHLNLAVVDRGPNGALRGDNLLALRPSWAWLAALAPMPMFFAAGGWANATASLERSAGRLRTLVGLGAVVVCCWSAGVIAVGLITGSAGITGDGARIATQPLWFLAAYVPLAAAGKPLAEWARRQPLFAVGSCVGLVAVIDVGRFALDLPKWIAWPGFYATWVVPWLLGAWWRHRWTSDTLGAGGRHFSERQAGAALALGGIATCVVLVTTAGYSPMLIDAIPGRRSNTTPPTLYTAVAAIAQVGVLMLAAPALDQLTRRGRRLLDAAGEAAVGIYVWHLTALSLCVALIAAGVPVPRRLTATWWWTRPLWFLLVLSVTAALLGITALVRSRVPRRERADGSRPAIVAGLVLAAATAGVLGLHGPRTPPWAFGCSAALVLAWWLLRPPRVTASVEA